MSTQQLPVDLEAQGAIYRVALSLDAFFMNGIQFGVLQRAAANGFLERTASSLLRDLASLEEHVAHAPVAHQARATEILASLRFSCQRVIDLVTGLRSFRTLPLEQVCSAASEIPILREACVQLIQKLEDCLRTPKPFYQSRPAHSTAPVNDFCTNLERLFAQEWIAAGEHRGG